MNQSLITDQPTIYQKLLDKSEEIGFTMPSDLFIGTLLKTLITSKPKSNILELGTGIGLSLSWMAEGLDQSSKLTSVDNDADLISIANEFFDKDDRIQLVCEDGTTWIKNYHGEQFDLVFADAWPGKYSETDEILSLIKVGGFYVIDDMNTQVNWPEGHQAKADELIAYLESRADFTLTKMDWSTGVIIMTRKY